jgi:ABC-type transport system involved in multi-copper enzyme maturation permease subunit
MALRLGPGPVFFYEWLLLSRRWQYYAGRALFAAALFAAFVFVYSLEASSRPLVSYQNLSKIGDQFFYAIIGTQIALVLLAAPAATAGAVCWEKARGTLTHIFVTDLSNNEIVLGKLLARLAPILGMILCCLPVLLLAGLLGGIDPEALVRAFLITVAVAILGCAVALTFSVWCSKTHEVLLATYMTWIVLLLAAPFYWFTNRAGPPPWMWDISPFLLAFAPYTRPGTTGWEEVFVYMGLAIGMSIVLITLATFRVRAVALAQTSRPMRTGRLWPKWFSIRATLARLPGPSLDRNPVLWREWHRARPARWGRIIWTVYAIAAFGCSCWAFRAAMASDHRELPALVNAFQVAIGLLLFTGSAVTVLADERANGSLDLLLTTPLPTWKILWGKWWGAYRTVLLLAVLPTIIGSCIIWPDVLTDVLTDAVFLSGRRLRWIDPFILPGLILAYGACFTSLGLALATWIARLGRAVVLCAVGYLFVSVGWIILMWVMGRYFARAGGSPGTLESLLSASPWWGVGAWTDALDRRDSSSIDQLRVPSIVWSFGYSVVAVGLFVATLATFNRCLGRMPYGTLGRVYRRIHGPTPAIPDVLPAHPRSARQERVSR